MITMWCNNCGCEFKQNPNTPNTPCRCGSTIRQSWKPQPYYGMYSSVSSSGGSIIFKSTKTT